MVEKQDKVLNGNWQPYLRLGAGWIILLLLLGINLFLLAFYLIKLIGG